jgi:hypothetical protein
MTSKLKVTIDRAKWRCGGDYGDFTSGQGPTKLLNRAGYMCCLGFITAAADPEINIFEKEEPCDLKTLVPGLTCPSPNHILPWINTSLTRAAIALNDSGVVMPHEREEALLKLFDDSPYQLEFVGKYSND